VPDKGAVANEGAWIGIVFARLTQDEIGVRRPFDMAVQLGFQGHASILWSRGRAPRLKQ
jgi:hypothetical protein